MSAFVSAIINSRIVGIVEVTLTSSHFLQTDILVRANRMYRVQVCADRDECVIVLPHSIMSSFHLSLRHR